MPALAVAADAGNKHALADAAGAGRRSRKRKVLKVAGQSTRQKNQAPKAKGALAAARRRARSKYLKNAIGQADPLEGQAWQAWLAHVKNKGPTWLYVALTLLSRHRSPAFESQRL